VNRELLVSPDVALLEAMDRLTRGSAKIVFVVDTDDVLVGTLTDGDIRRAILAGHELSGSIRGAYNPDPACVRQGGYTPRELRQLFQERYVDVVPIVDAAHRVVDHVTWHEAFEEPPDAGDIAGVPVVIMAGGMGTRLQPFTHVLPKPLLPIDGKPVIDHIMDRFRAAGATEFCLTLNHKARILRAYLEDAPDPEGVTFVQEASPLGTAGPLRLLAGRFTAPVVVTNCDVLVSIDYRALLDFHAKSRCDLTLVASVRSFRLPYGTCDIAADGTLQGIEEKQELTRLVNTGLYVIDPGLFPGIPADRHYDMNTFIDDLKASGRRVAVFPVSAEAWVDVGQWDEYQQATRLLGRVADRAPGATPAARALLPRQKQ
jgi:dTDP-glucose pyrophosphorylase